MATSSNALFRKFSMETISQLAATKASDQRRIRQALIEQYPDMTADDWEVVMPKKCDIMLVKCHDATNLVVLLTTDNKKQVLFFQHHDGPFLPHLKMLHRYPFLLPVHQVDIGGCKFVVSGANVMCPGVTHKDGRVGEGIDIGDPVAVKIQGKRHAVAVGFALMSSEDIKKKNKGHCIDNVHHLGDGLWRMEYLEG